MTKAKVDADAAVVTTEAAKNSADANVTNIAINTPHFQDNINRTTREANNADKALYNVSSLLPAWTRFRLAEVNLNTTKEAAVAAEADAAKTANDPVADQGEKTKLTEFAAEERRKADEAVIEVDNAKSFIFTDEIEKVDRLTKEFNDKKSARGAAVDALAAEVTRLEGIATDAKDKYVTAVLTAVYEDNKKKYSDAAAGVDTATRARDAAKLEVEKEATRMTVKGTAV